MATLINLINADWVELQLQRFPRKSGSQRLKDLYARVFRRGRARCVYCGTIEGPFQVDHAVPPMRGGTQDIENLVLACARCNVLKAFKTAAEFGYPQVQVQQPRTTYAEFCRENRRRW